MSEPLPKHYDPKAAQDRWLAFWESKGYGHSEPDASHKPFTIVIPPPNVTGALHMGHALNDTLQDVLIRWRRMQGYNALYMPGTDHAGIATQAVVEKLIFAQEKKTRHDLGREELVKRIWQWKDQYEKRILGQLRQLGCSCDWERTRFTLDEMCSKAVRETFFKMFRDGYIYRGKRLVNWDTHLQTAVADDEIFYDKVKGGFWTFRYPVVGTDQFIHFSTTRPETMLGDTAVAVHPDDERYKSLAGRKVTIPLNGRDIPIIADAELVDPTLGTGAVKVTPAHDPNDYQCGQRHKLPMLNILNPDGTVNAEGGEFAGLTFEKARDEVVAAMAELGHLIAYEDREIDLAHSDRSKTPIQPYLSDQWFVKMGDRDDGKPGLAQLAMDAVTSGKVRITPERYAKTYLDWLCEKRDWCISRQLWWGHQIPVWTRTGNQWNEAEIQEFGLAKQFDSTDTFVEMKSDTMVIQGRFDAESGATTSFLCIAPGHPEIEARFEARGFVRDPDVLDTWFSSALWPHSTLGWPEQTPELAYYYPTSVLITSRDIITLWVARMVLAGLYNLGEVPFRDVYIHPKILDGFGEGMSKSKGNGVDPLDIIDRYGTDALRFGMVHLTTETQDSRLPVANVCPHCDTLVPVKQEHMYMRTRKITCPNCKKAFRPGGPWVNPDPDLPTAKQASEKFELSRNFANKLWNASRFLLMNLDGYTPAPVDASALPVEDGWMLSRLATVTKQITGQLEAFKFSDVARTIYDFTWSEFCDWYVEMSKGRLKDEASRPTAQRVLVGVLDGIIRLVQPIMPFLAESVWQALGEVAPVRGLPVAVPAAESVVIAPWPNWPDAWVNATTEGRIARMQELVRFVREVRNRYQVEPKTALDVSVRCSPATANELTPLEPFIKQLAGVAKLEIGPDVVKPAQKASHVHPDFEAYVSLVGLIDPAQETTRLQKQIAEKRKFLQATQTKLSNEGFVARAPADVVQQQRELVAELESQIAALTANLAELR